MMYRGMYRGIDLIDGKSKDEMLHKFRSFFHFECVMIWCEREIATLLRTKFVCV